VEKSYWTFGFCSVTILFMIETNTLTMTSPLPSNLAVSKIKTYTRKLAEIERFIETLNTQPLAFNEPEITIHTYWQ